MDKSINGETKIFGLIGKGISGSLSPFIHNSLNKYLGINGVYVCFETKDVLSAVKGGDALGIKGFNITAPFKKDIIPFLKNIDENSKRSNSVNTLLYDEKGCNGFNTDYYGFFKLLQINGVNVKDKKVLVIGAGGSSSSICKVLEDSKVGQLHIANRTIEKAQAIKASIDENSIKKVKCMNLNDIDNEYDIIVQTTTVGFGENNDIPIDIEKIKRCEVAIDIIYKKNNTNFLNKCSDKKIKIIDGLDMLFYQAVKAYEIFNNIKVDEVTSLKCRDDLYKKIYE